MSLPSSGFLTSTQNTAARNRMQCFVDTLGKAGLKVFLNDDPHILTQEQSLVARDLEKLILQLQEQDLEDFLKGLKLLCSKQKHLRKALLHTVFKKSSENSETTAIVQQESLIRILMKVNPLQDEVVEIVLEEIANVASEEEQDTSYLRLLLQGLRYLPYIKEPARLTTKLLDVLDISTYASQLEILDSIAEILPDSQSDEISKQLCKLLDEKDGLAGAIIDCLNALNMESDVRLEVQDKILATILSGTCIKTFPILLEFLLTECKSTNLTGTLMKIRNALDTIMMTEGENEEEKSTQILIFNKLQTYATTSRAVTEAWLNMISSIKNHGDHKPIDFLILFMLHFSAKQKRGVIEGIFRKRVKDSLFKASLLEKMFETTIKEQLLIDYFQTMLDIGTSLMRTTNEPNVIYFGSVLFKTLFNHKYTSVIYRKELLDGLILLTGGNEQKNAAPILSIFSDLLVYITKMQAHTLLLMRLLEQIDTFELSDVKQVFEILCALTCGESADESMSGLKDEIHMIIRKQLSSSKRSVKHRGIISAVVMAKHIAITTEEQSDASISEDSMVSLSNLPEGPAKEAASLLELTSLCTAGSPDLMGLYYDQLAYMLVTTKNLNKHFMSWLYETVTNDFQNVFVTENVMSSFNGLTFSMQLSLNTDEEMDTPIAVNIAELTIRPETSENTSILILAPHFRLLRLLHFRQQSGDLSTIDALLGCAVILPGMNDLELLDSDQAKPVADCIFHCINWFREVISGFVTQKSKKLRNKVVNRLQHLIQLENKLNICMEQIPEHKLPTSYFDAFSQQSMKVPPTPQKKETTKRPKKKAKSAETVDDTIAPTCADASTSKPSTSKKSKTAPKCKVRYREMDTDILVLLKYPLKQEDTEGSQTIQGTQATFLNINQLDFILSDFVLKLKVLTKGKNLGLSHLNMVVPVDIITDCIMILPNINRHLTIVCERIDKALESANGKPNASELSQQEIVQLKKCFGLILECFSLIFNWSGFQQSKNNDLLKQILQALRPIQMSQQTSSINKLIVEFINKLSAHISHCLHLDYAVNLVSTMQAVCSLTTIQNNDIQKKIVSVCGKLLSKRWYNHTGQLDSGRNFSANLDILIKIYLEAANVKTITGLIGTLQEQTTNLKTKEHLEMLPSIDKTSFYILFRGVCTALQNRIKLEIQSLTNREHLAVWRNTALAMQGLMSITKTLETKNNLVCFLKKSIAILKVFLSHGIPILEIMLKSKPDEVVEIFKSMQTSTRFLHHLCCYSKLKKESSLIAYVPQFRLTLETLVYRVKAALVANNCSAAFWMGNLRNRDLQGEDILSQSTTVSGVTENEAEEEEDLPQDDSDNDILSDVNGDREDSVSY